MKSLEHLLKLKDLLQIEKEADLQAYNQKMLATSIEQKRKDGICWHPMSILNEQIGLGGRLSIEVERTKGLDTPHTFQSGTPVVLFSTRLEAAKQTQNAVIQRVSGNKAIIVLPDDTAPDWLYDGGLGMYLSFDEGTYREMNFALDSLLKLKNDSSRVAYLREVLLGSQAAEFDESIPPFQDSKLNESQNEALRKVVAAQDLAIIHGPPGTGKTTTLVAAIAQTLKTEKQVLVCAPSNTAVDLLCEKLIEKGISVTRIGHPARILEHLHDYSVDGKLSLHPDYKHYRDIIRKTEALFQQAAKYKRNFGRAEREERQALRYEARKLKEDAIKLEDYMLHHILDHAQVIAATLVGVSHQLIRHKQFTTAFIDEAAQALEPACLIPVLRTKRLVMAGDHLQLPPTIKSMEAAHKGLSKTLMERLMQSQKADVLLETQYRMHQDIMAFSNQKFYKNQLKAAEANKNHLIAQDEPPIELIDTAGCNFEETQEPETLSLYNHQEAMILLKHLERLLLKMQDQPDTAHELASLKIGIIAPYRAQVTHLRTHVEANDFLQFFKTQISIQTIDGFQGQEKDIIYISTVRSNSDQQIGFLSDLRRFNVALTRAKKKLVVISDSATLGAHQFFADFFAFMEQKGHYQSAWEYVEV
ncbi:MAG: IGHMBP2 family helicase [Cytophagales bacterium]|nr:MAG: IGHMBP2 family helicase [Cytophagales bacterium]